MIVCSNLNLSKIRFLFAKIVFGMDGKGQRTHGVVSARVREGI